MQVKSIVLFYLPLAALAAPAPQPESEGTLATFSGIKTTALIPREDFAIEEAAALEKRQGPISVVVSTVAATAATALTEAAVKGAVGLIKNVANWNNAREQFTQATVKDMFNRNPDKKKYHAAICYNKAYRVEKPAGVTGKVSAKLTSGPLNTNYDCMYMDAPNAFLTDSDGGFINLAYFYDNRCTHDKASGDLRCV